MGYGVAWHGAREPGKGCEDFLVRYSNLYFEG